MLSLDEDLLKELYIDVNNVHEDIKKYLGLKGFTSKQKYIYLGDDTVNSVRLVLAVQGLKKEFPWFKEAVVRMDMYRVYESVSLLPVLYSQ